MGRMTIGQGKSNEKFCTVEFRWWLSAIGTANRLRDNVANPICTNNTAQFDPGNGQDIVLPPGYSVSVFKSGLNFPTGIAFRLTSNGGFEVYVLEFRAWSTQRVQRTGQLRLGSV